MTPSRLARRALRLQLLAAASYALASAACINSLHLDPTGGGAEGGSGGEGGGSGGSTGGNGGSAGTGGAGGSSGECVSNSDCTFPSSFCDDVKGLCVQCIDHPDCDSFRPGTVCSAGQCVCPTPGESYCDSIDFPAPVSDQAAGCYPDDDKLNCGACGKRCIGSCSMGMCTGDWQATSLLGAPTGRTRPLAVSTGSKMLVWGGTGGGKTGGVYDPVSDVWTVMSETGAPAERADATAVWDGSKMVVWGGEGATGFLNSGAMYDPATDTWSAMSTVGAPAPRARHAAVWIPTASKMLVFGGFNGATLGDAALFDPAANTWAPIASAPSARREATATWDGVRVLVFGGVASNDTVVGGLMSYDLAAWAVPDPTGEPEGRRRHSAVWDGTGLVVWGGVDGANQPLASGARYQGGWLTMAPPPVAGRSGQAAVFAQNKVYFYGGQGAFGLLDDGAAYTGNTNTWTTLPVGAGARTNGAGLLLGDRFLLWGGTTASGSTNEGAVYQIN